MAEPTTRVIKDAVPRSRGGIPGSTKRGSLCVSIARLTARPAAEPYREGAGGLPRFGSAFGRHDPKTHIALASALRAVFQEPSVPPSERPGSQSILSTRVC